MMEQPCLFDLPPARKRKTRADQLFEQFKKYHKENPHIWGLFKRYTFELLGAGRKHYGSMEIMGRIRWHTEVETRGDTFKCNHNHKTFYARMFEATYPDHAGFFRLRKRTSQKKPARGDGETFVNTDPPENEVEIMNELRLLGGKK